MNPSAAQDSDDLIGEIDVDSVDADSDLVTYTFTWSLNGNPYGGTTSTTHYTGDTIPSSETYDGDIWECTVTPNDGADDGSLTTAQVLFYLWDALVTPSG